MKKSLIALAVLAASGAAMAQSSVTLYGVVDTGLTYSKGAESVYGMTHVGGNVNSRLGFRGVEDLGNGLKATFNLESGFSADDGTNYMGQDGLAFTRTSTVGLAGNFGEVRLGRMLTSSYLAVSRYDAFGDTGIGASRGWAGDFGYNARTQNAISFTSNNYSGFKFGFEYGLGEQVKARTNRYLGAGVTYDNGPLSLGLGVERRNNAGFAYFNDQDDDFIIKDTTGDATTFQLGGAYNFGVAKVMAFYEQSKVKDLAFSFTDLVTPNPAVDVNSDIQAKYKTFGLGVAAPVGAAGEVKVAYNHYRASVSSADLGISTPTYKANQLSLGYVHNLSKRTALYGTYAYLKNKNKDGDNLGLELNGAMKGAGLSKSGAQHGLQVGIRHAF